MRRLADAEGRVLWFGLRAHTITRDGSAEAWATTAQRLLDELDPQDVAASQAKFAASESTGRQRRMAALHGGRAGGEARRRRAASTGKDLPLRPATLVEPLAGNASAYVQLPGGWFLNNAGWVVGQDRTLVIDTCATEDRTRRLLDEARAAGHPSAPVSAVLTHAHGDHAHGAGLVERVGADVLASKAAAAEVATGPHTFPALFPYDGWGCIAPPAEIHAIDRRLTLDLGGTAVEIVTAPGKAHTDGDLVAFLPESGVLFTGDLLFHDVTPLALQGSITGWRDALDWLHDFRPAQVVPGHGPVTDDLARLTAETRRYFDWLLDVVEPESPDFDALERAASERWPAWSEPERHPVNLRVAHAERHGAELDVEEVITAMLRAAGGPIALEI